MASIVKETNSKGEVVYKVRVANGRGKRVTRSWKPDPKWSAKTTERKLNQFAAELENKFKSGAVSTKKEKAEAQRQAEIEAAKIKTFRQYAEEVWLPGKLAGDNIAENTRLSYIRNVNIANEQIGDIPIKEITSAMLTKLLISFQQKGKKYATCVKLYNVLNGIFKTAFEDETIETNPMLRVHRPKKSRREQIEDEQKKKVYTPTELNHILESIAQEPLKWQTYICIAAHTGMRKGEITGLHWNDIDFSNKTINVVRNLQYSPDKGIYETTPKSGKTRKVNIPNSVLVLLRELRAEQASTCISQYVFTQNSSPLPMHPDTPTEQFKSFGKKYNIESFHPHILRHTWATISIDSGANQSSVSKALGHADVATTLRMYTHPDEEGVKIASEIFERAIEQASNG